MRRLVATLSLAMFLAPPALAAGAPFAFVADSPGARGGERAVDGDFSTTWIGLATPTHPAWLTVRLKHPARVSGLLLTMGRMAPNTFLHIALSQDGEHFANALTDVRHAADGPTLHAFERPEAVAFVRLTFENASRQAVVPFDVQEVVPVLDQPANALPATGDVALRVPTPPMRVLGAVWGKHEGRGVLVIVTDPSEAPISEVTANGRALKVLSATSTQLLCAYPYARPVHVDIAMKFGGRLVTRTVATVSRAIQWPPPPQAPTNTTP